MRSLFYNISVPHNQNYIRIFYGRQSMCNNK
ncbi:MAG: hypothetical protein ACI4RS_03645 [Monoglobaceae bacterium]